VATGAAVLAGAAVFAGAAVLTGAAVGVAAVPQADITRAIRMSKTILRETRISISASLKFFDLRI
jgi:hypothetical protein